MMVRKFLTRWAAGRGGDDGPRLRNMTVGVTIRGTCGVATICSVSTVSDPAKISQGMAPIGVGLDEAGMVLSAPMIASRRWFWRILAAAVLALDLFAAGSGAAVAQIADCGRLQAQIASLSHAGGAHAAAYDQAAQKQRGEIDRTSAYARSIGCENRQFLIFGSPPPPQCGAILTQIQRMRSNLEQLQSLAERAGGGPAVEAQRRDLIGRFNSYCGPGAVQRAEIPQPKGFFETLFGGGTPQPPADIPQQVPLDEPTAGEDMHGARGGPKAVCVRLADGGFFPVSYAAHRNELEDLEDLCRALCPNTEVKLYTYTLSGDIEQAVSIDGDVYTALPNALKYQKTYDPTASCKPPGQNWQQVLGGAEELLGNTSRRDVIVTPEKAEELSRPKLDQKAVKTKVGVALETPQPIPSPKIADDATASEAAAAAQVPTAGRESAGISQGDARNGVTVGAGQGVVREVTGPDGLKRKIRIIGPTL
jgi:hypothetical protein